MIQNVRYFERRIMTLDNAEPERFITSEKKNVLVDSYIKCEQILTISKDRLINQIGHLSEDVMNNVFQTITSLLR